MTEAEPTKNNRVRVKSSGLAYLRELSGKSARQVAASMAQELGEKSRHLDSVYKLEERGSTRLDILEAYATAIETDFELIKKAARAQKNK